MVLIVLVPCHKGRDSRDCYTSLSTFVWAPWEEEAIHRQEADSSRGSESVNTLIFNFLSIVRNTFLLFKPLPSLQHFVKSSLSTLSNKIKFPEAIKEETVKSNCILHNKFV